jgi:pimeloyl-ACP methyl ester carboxylesterase
MDFVERLVQRDRYRIYAREYPGEDPAIILMHGFPDNLHLYDRLVPYLSPPRRVITFDFLGWGSSDKPTGYPYLNSGVAQRFHELFPTSDLFLLATARHFVQMDEPEEVARLILSAPANSSQRG